VGRRDWCAAHTTPKARKAPVMRAPTIPQAQPFVQKSAPVPLHTMYPAVSPPVRIARAPT
jgi:hypothetical protein